jgi:hypothetical protein
MPQVGFEPTIRVFQRAKRVARYYQGCQIKEEGMSGQVPYVREIRNAYKVLAEKS